MQVVKRGMIRFKRIQDFYQRHPGFLYEGVLIGTAVFPLERILNCALTCSLCIYLYMVLLIF